MSDDELTERVSVALSKWHLRAVDEWRRQHPELPTRGRAVRLMIEAMTARAAPTKAPLGVAKPARKAPAKRKGKT